jgi:hypothetical protein
MQMASLPRKRSRIKQTVLIPVSSPEHKTVTPLRSCISLNMCTHENGIVLNKASWSYRHSRGCWWGAAVILHPSVLLGFYTQGTESLHCPTFTSPRGTLKASCSESGDVWGLYDVLPRAAYKQHVRKVSPTASSSPLAGVVESLIVSGKLILHSGFTEAWIPVYLGGGGGRGVEWAGENCITSFIINTLQRRLLRWPNKRARNGRGMQHVWEVWRM